MLKMAPPRVPRDVAKGRFSFDALGEVLYVRKADKKGRKEKWMRESRSRRSDRYADYKVSISRLGHAGNDRVLRRNFGACVQPLMAVEKVLMTVPMGSSARRDLHQARSVGVAVTSARIALYAMLCYARPRALISNTLTPRRPTRLHVRRVIGTWR
jgi:hypothetical protein